MEEQRLPHHSDEEIDAILDALDRMGQAKPAPAPKPEQPDNLRREIFEWVRTLAIAALAAVALFVFVFRFVMVEGVSMEPTLQNGVQLIMLSLFYTPENGDIVILSDKTGLDKPLVKRVIATGGQTVELDGGTVFVDGEPLTEPYVPEAWADEGNLTYPLTVPEGSVFVMGDNRNHSTDSRSSSIGLVDEDEVLGKIIFRIFPLSRIGLID